jgi:drug/metabolite transporter (DMT)-like permease
VNRRDGLAASGLLLASALLWGTLWIPLREIRATGPSGPLLVAIGFLLPLGVLVPFAVRRGPQLRRGGPALAGGGLGLALSIALYSEGLVRGSVARVVLLFYLMPVWTTLLARLYRSQPISPRRLASIALGLAGLAVIYGPELATAGPSRSGDWMGLVAGVTWAATMVLLLPAAAQSSFDRVLAQFAFLGPAYLLVSLLPGRGAAAAAPSPLPLPILWLLAFSLVWMLPVVWLTILGASRLEPGRAAVLLMLEVAVALSSAAWVAGEPFSAREALGAALVTGAGLLEVAARRDRSGRRVRMGSP